MNDRDRTKGPGDERLEAEGEVNEGKGKLRQTKADIQQTVENAKDRFTR